MRLVPPVVFFSLAAGLLVGDAVALVPWAWGALGAIATALAAALARRPGVGLPLLALAWFCAGGAVAIPAERAPRAPPELAEGGRVARFVGRVIEPPVRAYGRTRLVVDLERVRLARRWRRLRVRARVTVGAPIHEIAVGDRVAGRARFRAPRILANPGAAHLARTLRYEGTAVAATAQEPSSIVRLLDEPDGGLWRALDAMRADLAARLAGRGEGALLSAFFLGDRGGLTRADREAFAVTGVSHTLAVSGQHLAIVAFLLYRLLAWLLSRWESLAVRLHPRRPAAAITLVAAGAYTLFVGAPFSAVRAFAMAALYLGGVILARPSRRADALWLGAACIVGSAPGALFDVGFQLSVLAVLGLLYIAPSALALLTPRPDPFGALLPPSRLRRAWRTVATLIAATAGALAATSAVVAHHFQIFTPLGFLGALIVVPVLELWILPVSLAATLLPPASEGLWTVAEIGASCVRTGLEWLTALDAAAVSVRPPTEVETAALTVAAFLVPSLRRRAGRLALGVVIAVWGASVGAGLAERHLGSALRITFLSVGHGDAAVVQAPGGEALLVDGGGSLAGDFDVGREVVAPALRALGVSRLRAVVLSHAHPDHAQGLAHVIRAFDVREVWTNGQPFGKGGAELEAAVREHRVPVRWFRPGERPPPLGPVEIEVLHPLPPADEPVPYYRELGENDNSLVLAVRYGAFRALLPGDLEDEGEAVLLESGRPLAATVLKAPHHGSRTSTTPALLRAVSPRVVVFSVGAANLWGFPHLEVDERVRRGGARTLRTDVDGAVQVRTDGRSAEVLGLRSGVRLLLPLAAGSDVER